MHAAIIISILTRYNNQRLEQGRHQRSQSWMGTVSLGYIFHGTHFKVERLRTRASTILYLNCASGTGTAVQYYSSTCT